MQQRLNVVLKEGFSEINKAESELRVKTSEVRAASSGAGVLEARNAELQRILEEEERDLLALESQQTSRFEAREMAGMAGTAGLLEARLQAVHRRVEGLVSRMGARSM